MSFSDIPFQQSVEKSLPLSFGGNLKVLIFIDYFGTGIRGPKKFQILEIRKPQCYTAMKATSLTQKPLLIPKPEQLGNRASFGNQSVPNSIKYPSNF